MILRDVDTGARDTGSAPAVAGEAPPRPAKRLDPCALVVFGGTGDLAKRKLVPALYNLAKVRELPAALVVIGVGRTRTSAAELAATHHDATAEFSRTQPLDEDVWRRLASSLDHVAGDLDDPGTYSRLAERLARADRESGTGGNRIFYFATPASGFPIILRRLAASGLLPKAAAEGATPWTRVVIEKPFGSDLASARALDDLVAEVAGERRVFRIDHYMGKETVQNLVVLRFGNAIFEPLWNRKYVDHVEITAAESIGIEGRGSFYDETGVVRDVVQNHLLQVLALCAMEPPVNFSADELQSKKEEVYASLRPIREPARETVLGQYRGYTDEPHVGRDSRTPTYAALRVFVDNWRWQGVPFYLRAGKRLAKRVTEIAIHFQSVPLCLFPQGVHCQMERNVLSLRIQPDEGVSLRFACKVPGDELVPRSVSMDMSYADTFAQPVHEAYERLLLDVMRGDRTLFWRRRGVELAWAFVEPLLAAPAALALYEPGSEGPREASDLLARDDRQWKKLA